MTPQKFIRWAEACFGEYRPLMREEVAEWLRIRSPFMLDALREVALRDHPSVYGKPPGVHELEKMRLEAQEKGHSLEAIEAARTGRPAIAENTDEETLREELDEKLSALWKKFGVKTKEVKN